MNEAAIKWVSGPHTGASSQALWSAMMGHPNDKSHPHDTDDLWRCLRLLELVPEWKSRIGEMRTVSPYWAALADRWDELTAAMFKELGPELKRDGPTPLSSKIMKDALTPVEDADPRFFRVGRMSIQI